MFKARSIGVAVLAASLMTVGFVGASTAQVAPVKSSAVAAAAPIITVQESVYVAITPCRLADTRVMGGDYTNLQVRSMNVSGTVGFPAQGGKAGGCGIPATATAIAASMTAISPTGKGFVRLWPAERGQVHRRDR